MSRAVAAAVIAVLIGAGCGGSVGSGLDSPSPAASAFPSSAGPPPSSTPAPSVHPTLARIADLQARIAADDSDAEAYRDLGLTLLQRVRETADSGLYPAAEAALDKARSLVPDDPLTLVGVGGLQLARHEFAAALETGQRAVELAPNLGSAHAVVVDALVELGRYDEADGAAGRMLAAATDLTTLSRVSYLAELRGDLDTALGAMRLATQQGDGLPAENRAFTLSIVGHLELLNRDPEAAHEAFDAALKLVPDHPPSRVGLARLAVGEGRLDVAIGILDELASEIPLPEYVVALGEAQSAAGDTTGADRSFRLAATEIRLFEANGVSVDLDLAIFEADHGDPAVAHELAAAAYAETPTIRAADALAWALHRLGRDEEAIDFADEALRLGSVDPLLHFHAGAIAAALGQDDRARTELELVLATDPGFSALGAAEARWLLDDFR